jgi:hypothetical protein
MTVRRTRASSPWMRQHAAFKRSNIQSKVYSNNPPSLQSIITNSQLYHTANMTDLTTPSENPNPKIIRVAATQLESVDFDLNANVAKACKYIALAAEQGCKLIGFSECFIPGYPYFIW